MSDSEENEDDAVKLYCLVSNVRPLDRFARLSITRRIRSFDC